MSSFPRLTAASVASVLVAGCALFGPRPECDPAAVEALRPMSCQAAVAAAKGALEDGHPQIVRSQFLFGSAMPCCGRLPGPGELESANAYVVFTYADESREWVSVTRFDGRLTIGEPLDY